jgi:cyd operon protein YbgT
MWYFAWMLGVGFAILLAILNAMWHEAQEDRATIAGNAAKPATEPEPAPAEH